MQPSAFWKYSDEIATEHKKDNSNKAFKWTLLKEIQNVMACLRYTGLSDDCSRLIMSMSIK